MNIIQIGSNDGNDHVLRLVKEKESEIQELILVDALPECAMLTRRQYSFFKGNLSVINMAIGTKDGLIDIFYPKGQHHSTHASSSFDFLVACRYKEIEKIKIPCLNINSFLDSLRFEKIDYLFIDTEGMDVPILLEMDFDKYSPTNLIFEDGHSEGPGKARGKSYLELVNKLERFNYSISEGGGDTIAKKVIKL